MTDLNQISGMEEGSKLAAGNFFSTGSAEITRVPIESDQDIVTARQKAREIAFGLGMTASEAAVIATTVSELARNILLHARKGEIILRIIQDTSKLGIEVIASDYGPGTPGIRHALLQGFSTPGGHGYGLPAVKRLMDEFTVVSQPGRGTTVTIRRWKR